jgi:hypothetical protein
MDGMIVFQNELTLQHACTQQKRPHAPAYHLSLHAKLACMCCTTSPPPPLAASHPGAGLNKQLGLSNELFALGDSAMLTVLGQVSFMPVLVLAARICPEVWHQLQGLWCESRGMHSTNVGFGIRW